MVRPRVYSDDRILAALEKTRGLVFLAAKTLGCNPDTIRDRARVSPGVAAAVAAHRGRLVDTAEMKLADAIDAGEPWAVALTLKTLGKDRGYVERKELTGAGGGPISEVREIVVRTRDEAQAVVAALAAAGEVPGQPG